MEHTKFLEKARKLKGEQATKEYEFLELLVQQEEDRLSWLKPKTPYKTWGSLLQHEGLCTVITYQNYKRARNILSASWIEKLGVYASISITKLDADARAKVFTQVKSWYSNHEMAPTYQRVSKYVRDLGKTVRRTKTENKIQKLRAYIKKCQALLKKNRIPIPEETWT